MKDDMKLENAHTLTKLHMREIGLKENLMAME